MDPADLSFFVCMTISAILVGLIIMVYSLMIYHFFIAKEDLIPLVKATCVTSINLSMLTGIILFVTFPECHSPFYCGNNFRGNFLLLMTADFYILSKLSLYTVFMTRLHFSFNGSSYQYSKCVYFALFIIIAIILIVLIVFNAAIITEVENYYFILLLYNINTCRGQYGEIFCPKQKVLPEL